MIVPNKISEIKTELRCAECGGIIGWWESREEKKVLIPRRPWTKQELEELK